MDKPVILFDLGGTLMEGPCMSPATRFVAELGLQDSDKAIINNFLFTEHITDPGVLAEKFQLHFPAFGAAQLKIIRDIWHSQFTEGYVLPGAFSLLGKIADKGWRAGIISNIWHPFYASFRELFRDYLHLFDVVTLSYEAGCEKPTPALFTKTLEAFRESAQGEKPVSLRHICMVGDSYYHDMRPALDLGLSTTWILHKPSREIPFLEDICAGQCRHPHLIVSTLAHLAENFSLLESLLESGHR